jgi:membrane protein DedA with SNARE-associated domain
MSAPETTERPRSRAFACFLALAAWAGVAVLAGFVLTHAWAGHAEHRRLAAGAAILALSILAGALVFRRGRCAPRRGRRSDDDAVFTFYVP